VSVSASVDFFFKVCFLPLLHRKDFFGCQSIADFIASGFLPYIFMLYIFVIQGLVVFEKSSKLRDIMVMSGLKMRVYWTVLWAFYFAQYLFMVLILWVAGVLTELRTFTIHGI